MSFPLGCELFKGKGHHFLFISMSQSLLPRQLLENDDQEAECLILVAAKGDLGREGREMLIGLQGIADVVKGLQNRYVSDRL